MFYLKNTIRKYQQGFMALVYPRLCFACSNTLYEHEQYICSYCKANMPKTNYHKTQNNPLESIFYGRASIQFAYSFLMFSKLGSVQNILHNIKYKSHQDLAFYIGAWYAEYLKHLDQLKNIDYLIPVPLHKKKQIQRGFNQSEAFANGLASVLNIEVKTEELQRQQITATQTKKSRFDRWENVENAFCLNNAAFFLNKKIILIDDVITTGATIEACYKAFELCQNLQFSVLSMAYATVE